MAWATIEQLADYLDLTIGDDADVDAKLAEDLAVSLRFCNRKRVDLDPAANPGIPGILTAGYVTHVGWDGTLHQTPIETEADPDDPTVSEDITRAVILFAGHLNELRSNRHGNYDAFNEDGTVDTEAELADVYRLLGRPKPRIR